MKPSTIGIFPPQGFIQALSKRLIIPTLTFLALPCLLSAQTLQHRYSFVSDASDSVGTANGTVVAPTGGSPVTIANGLTLPGGGGPNFSGYVSLPAGILTTTTNLTVECWATQNAQNGWAELYSFNNGQSQYLGFIPYPANNGNNASVAFKTGNNESDALSASQFAVGTPQYAAVTYNANTLIGNLYTNGVLIASVTTPNSTFAPGAYGGAGGTLNNWLGQDPYGDPQFQGTIYEFRIWNGVVSQRYLQASAIAGPTVLVNNLTPTAASLTTASTNMVMSAGQQAVFMVQLPQTGANNLLATADATNWVSSNPSVLSVNSSGRITAVGVGNATVSAKVGGVSATSSPIFVTPLALLHRYSFVSDASDSVGGANGTIVPPGDPNGTNVTISNGLFLPGGGGPGYSGYVSLPSGILTNTSGLTIECWATQNAQDTWAELYSFNNGQPEYTSFIPYPANNGNNMVAGFRTGGNESDVNSSSKMGIGAEQYIAVTLNAGSLVGSLYTNGGLIATATLPNGSYVPGTYGGGTGTVNNYLGQDPWPDPQFQGTIYEFRIWNGAVSPAYVAASAVAGPSVVITNVTPTSLTVSLASTSMVGAGTQQATVSGNFLQVSGVTLTGAATNWISSNPSVLSVSSSGLITALNGGTATVSATVNGVSATSALITVATTPPNPTSKPSNVTVALGGTATFSVQALGGNLNYQWKFGATPITGATNTTLVLTNVTFANAGTYTVSVTNTLGSTNVSATLTVLQAVLQHRYSFVSDAHDSVGSANGTLVAPGAGSPATIANGLSLPGGGGGGFSGYLALPAGILTNTTSLTVECWVTENAGNNWATIWDFGNNGSQNFELCPQPDPGRNGGNMLAAFTPNNGEQDLNTPSPFPVGVEQYVSVTYNNATLGANLYTNGAVAGTTTLPNTTYRPGSIGGAAGTADNWLGNNVYGDPQFQGTVYELRIWDGAVSPLYLAISALAGPSVVVTNLTPVSLSVTVTNSSMTQGSTQSAAVTGNFVDASGVPVTGAVTNWSSSNPAVLTVNANGVITAVGTGSATITAKVNGATGTSASISVPTSGPIITQNLPASETLLVGATLNVSVSNIGTPPFVYRWYTNSGLVPISTSSSPTLTIPNLQVANSGNYTCLVSNQYGTALSSVLSLTVVAPSTYAQAILALNPIGYWPLNETSGNIAYDVIGGYNGTYNTAAVNGSTYTLAQAGPPNAFFGGTSLAAQFFSAYVDIPGSAFNLTGPVTAVAWVQLLVTPGFDGLVGKGDTSWRTSINPSSQPGGNDGTAPGDATSLTSINDNNWHMVVYSYTGNTNQNNNGALYVDGALVANNTVPVPPAGNNLDVWIGGAPDYGTARLLPAANIAQVAIFNQALTAAQVQGLTNGVAIAGPQTINIALSGHNVILNWQTGTLLQSTNLLGPWTTNSAAVSPYTIPATNASQFFRLRVSP